MIDINEIKSVIRFKSRLVKELPFAPNNRDSKEFLLSLDIGDVIHIYDFWKQRLIDARPREVVASGRVRNSALYVRNRGKINALLERVRKGLDIGGYLSNKAHSTTFDVEEFRKNRSFNSFRDQILICEGFYHVHLAEFPKRTNEVLIVHLTPTTFEVVHVAKHNLFESNSSALIEYGEFVEHFVRSKNPAGGIILGGAGGGMQNLAGSSIESTLRQICAQRILHNVEVVNGGIECYVKYLYQRQGKTVRSVKPEWQIINREIVIYDRKNDIHFNEPHLRL